MQGVKAMSHTTTPKGENQTNITFSDIANNPQGLTPLNDSAMLFNRHAETLRRWVRSDKNPSVKPVAVNGFYFFKNSDLLEFIEKQQATA